MKVLVLMESDYDYDYCSTQPVGAFVVPDDFNIELAHRQWAEETLRPATGRNQYGEWKSKRYGVHTQNFPDWLREKFERIEVVTWEP